MSWKERKKKNTPAKQTCDKFTELVCDSVWRPLGAPNRANEARQTAKAQLQNDYWAQFRKHPSGEFSRPDWERRACVVINNNLIIIIRVHLLATTSPKAKKWIRFNSTPAVHLDRI